MRGGECVSVQPGSIQPVFTRPDLTARNLAYAASLVRESWTFPLRRTRRSRENSSTRNVRAIEIFSRDARTARECDLDRFVVAISSTYELFNFESRLSYFYPALYYTNTPASKRGNSDELSASLARSPAPSFILSHEYAYKLV